MAHRRRTPPAKAGKGPSAKKDPPRRVASVTKRLRMTPEDARILARLARSLGKTESDVLREGLEMVRLKERRLALIDDLLAGAEADDYRKERFELR